jgi:hypothetical protein
MVYWRMDDITSLSGIWWVSVGKIWIKRPYSRLAMLLRSLPRTKLGVLIGLQTSHDPIPLQCHKQHYTSSIILLVLTKQLDYKKNRRHSLIVSIPNNRNCSTPKVNWPRWFFSFKKRNLNNCFVIICMRTLKYNMLNSKQCIYF